MMYICPIKNGDVPSNHINFRIKNGCFSIQPAGFRVFLGGLSDPPILPGSVDVSLVWGLKASDAMPLLGKAALAWHFQVPS